MMGSLHTIASLIRGIACAGVSLAVAVHRRLTAAAYARRGSRESYASSSMNHGHGASVKFDCWSEIPAILLQRYPQYRLAPSANL